MKCPVCNSTTFKGTKYGKRCKKCGYTWKKKVIDQDTKFAKDYRYGSVRNNVIPIINYHNVAYKFKILGDSQIQWSVIRKMRGWVQQWDYEDGVKALKTPKNVIIFLDKRFKKKLKKLKDVDVLDREIKDKIIAAARRLQDKYKIVLDLNNAIPLRKEIKLEEGFKSPMQFKTEVIKVVYPDGSVEFINAEAVQHFKNFFRNIAALDKVETLEQNLAEFAANFKLHQQVLNEMSETLKSIATERKGFFTKLIEKSKGVFKWLMKYLKK